MPSISSKIETQRQEYIVALRKWIGAVRDAKCIKEALREAMYQPVPGLLMRSAASRSNPDNTWALRTVDRILRDMLDELPSPTAREAHIAMASRLTWAASVMSWVNAVKHGNLPEPTLPDPAIEQDKAPKRRYAKSNPKSRAA